MISLFSCENKRPQKRDYKNLPDSISLGQAFYTDECARCHGDNGEGNKKKDIAKLKDADFSFDEMKQSMYYPEGTMPEFDDVPDTLIHEIRKFIHSL